MIISKKALQNDSFDLSAEQPLPTKTSILSESEVQKLKRLQLAEQNNYNVIEEEDGAIDLSDVPAGFMRDHPEETKYDFFKEDDNDEEEMKMHDYNEKAPDTIIETKPLKERKAKVETKKDDDEDVDEEDDEDGGDSDTDSESESGDGSSQSSSRVSRASSDASHLTEPPVEGGFKHHGWTYQAYRDRLERLERYPKELSELREEYESSRKEANQNCINILNGAKERRQFFANLTGAGFNVREALDQSECHRLSRDSVRRRYELEKADRRHFAARDKFLNYVRAVSDEARRAKQERDRIRGMLLAGQPGIPRAVEVGHEFITVEWAPPKTGAGDIMRYELSACNLVNEGYDVPPTLEEIKQLAEQGFWTVVADPEKDFSRHSQLFTLNDLEANASYLVRVRALNCAGWGAYSLPSPTPLSLASDQDSGSSKLISRKSVFNDAELSSQPNGWLDKIFSEICNAMEKNSSEFSELFEQLDVDNSGTVNRKEVASGLKLSLNLVLDESQLDLLLMEFDKDGNGEVQYDEFVDALEDYKFRKALSSKKKIDVMKTLENFSLVKTKQEAKQSRDSTDSFDSDILRHSLDGFAPSENVIWDVEAAKGVKRTVGGVSSDYGLGEPFYIPEEINTLAINRKFEHFWVPDCRKKTKHLTKFTQKKLKKSSLKNEEDDDDEIDEEEDEDDGDGEFMVKDEDIFQGEDEYQEMELDEGTGYILNDPLQDMPRSEVSVTFQPMVKENSDGKKMMKPLPLKIEADDLGRLVVMASKDEAFEAGVLPGFHLVSIDHDVVWPPCKRRLSRSYATKKLALKRPISLLFEKCYPVKQLTLVLAPGTAQGFSLDQHSSSNVLFIDKIESVGGHPAGFLTNDIIVSVGGVESTILEKHGTKGHRLHKLLNERPLEIEISRGGPLHIKLLPPRSSLNPDIEKMMIKKRVKESLKKGHANRNHLKNQAKRLLKKRPSMTSQKSNLSESGASTSLRQSRKLSLAQKKFFDKDGMVGVEEDNDNFEGYVEIEGDGGGWESLDTGTSASGVLGSNIFNKALTRKKSLSSLSSGGGAASGVPSDGSSGGGGLFNKMMTSRRSQISKRLVNQLPPSQRNLEFLEIELKEEKPLGMGIMDSIGGVEIISLEPEGLAMNQGLKLGDLILHINNKAFHPEKKCKRATFLKKLSQEPKPCFIGIGRPKEANDLQNEDISVELMDIIVTNEDASCGLTFEKLVNEVVVTSVALGSACAQALEGDVLVAINRIPVDLGNISELNDLLEKTKKPMILTFERRINMNDPHSRDRQINNSSLDVESLENTEVYTGGPPSFKEEHLKKKKSTVPESYGAITFLQKVTKYSALDIELKMVQGFVTVSKVKLYGPGHALGFAVDDVVVATGSGETVINAPLDSPLFLKAKPGSLSISKVKKLMAKAPRPAILIVDHAAKKNQNDEVVTQEEDMNTIKFEIRDRVQWKASDEDVPEGLVGTIIRVDSEDEQDVVEVEFRIEKTVKRFMFLSHRLNLVERASATSPQFAPPSAATGSGLSDVRQQPRTSTRALLFNNMDEVVQSFGNTPHNESGSGGGDNSGWVDGRWVGKQEATNAANDIQAAEVPPISSLPAMATPRMLQPSAVSPSQTQVPLLMSPTKKSTSLTPPKLKPINVSNQQRASKEEESHLQIESAGNREGVSANSQVPEVSTVLVLQQMVSPEMLEDEDEYQEILEDVREECSEFGTVLEVFIPRPLEGDTQGIGKVFVEFDSEEAALNGAHAMKGRHFDGKVISCAFLGLDHYDAGELDKHTQDI